MNTFLTVLGLIGICGLVLMLRGIQLLRRDMNRAQSTLEHARAMNDNRPQHPSARDLVDSNGLIWLIFTSIRETGDPKKWGGFTLASIWWSATRASQEQTRLNRDPRIIAIPRAVKTSEPGDCYSLVIPDFGTDQIKQDVMRDCGIESDVPT